MTKTESLRAAIKTMAIETCQEWLQCEMSEGVRAAIPNTKNLIMAGPADWIAKHLPGVEAIADLSQFGSIRDYADFREDLERLSEPGLAKAQAKIIRKEIYDTIDARVANAIKAYRLAATTQASTAQADLQSVIAQALYDALTAQIEPGERAPGIDWFDGREYDTLAEKVMAAIRALRAGDTGEQADGGAPEQEGA